MIAAVIAAAGLLGCGTSKQLPYQQRIDFIEATYARCGNEPSNRGYELCMRRNEGTIRSYLEHLCPHPGGYMFEGAHEPCPPAS